MKLRMYILWMNMVVRWWTGRRDLISCVQRFLTDCCPGDLLELFQVVNWEDRLDQHLFKLRPTIAIAHSCWPLSVPFHFGPQSSWLDYILDWLLPLRHGISETDEAWRFKGAKEFFVLLFWLFSSSAWMSCATLCQTDIIWENFSLWCLRRLKIHCTMPTFCWIITLLKGETRSISYTHKIYL